MDEKIIDLFMELEEKNFLQKKKIFEVLKLNGEIESLLEQIANETFCED